VSGPLTLTLTIDRRAAGAPMLVAWEDEGRVVAAAAVQGGRVVKLPARSRE